MDNEKGEETLVDIKQSVNESNQINMIVNIKEEHDDDNVNNVGTKQEQPNEDCEMFVNELELSKMTKEQLINLCQKKDKYIDHLKEMLNRNESKNNINQLNFNQQLKQQQLESSRKENILIMRLTLKEQELQECLTQIEALKLHRIPTNTQLESYLLDPALNYMFERMKKEVDASNTRVEEMQKEMNAWKFSTDSATGKRLMAKCRQLHQENEELGKMISSGKIAQLEGNLAMHTNYSEEVKKTQSEIEEVLIEMEEDIEGLQNTVYHLQQQAKEEKEKKKELLRIHELNKEQTHEIKEEEDDKHDINMVQDGQLEQDTSTVDSL
ncbi:hypothetical protein RDWZM_006818 [Blomia tropicalis]|uniref:Pre-mRNA-splicing regulator WTAP n=1 Tax=Blomia tropicalis TaxID=40697 RepID=A0A9Q0RPN4_BLOTA|nr:hypothetical protein RDWZM_006818 [Blomia tropicalis]